MCVLRLFAGRFAAREGLRLVTSAPAGGFPPSRSANCPGRFTSPPTPGRARKAFCSAAPCCLAEQPSGSEGDERAVLPTLLLRRLTSTPQGENRDSSTQRDAKTASPEHFAFEALPVSTHHSAKNVVFARIHATWWRQKMDKYGKNVNYGSRFVSAIVHIHRHVLV